MFYYPVNSTARDFPFKDTFKFLKKLQETQIKKEAESKEYEGLYLSYVNWGLMTFITRLTTHFNYPKGKTFLVF